jgi:CxxC motif-containing protein (DUF1111 family)
VNCSYYRFHGTLFALGIAVVSCLSYRVQLAGSNDGQGSGDGAALFTKTWAASEGLGPFLNAQSCVACHMHPTLGGTSTKKDDFVLVSPETTDPSGGRVFQIFELRPNGATILRPLPRHVARRKPPSLFGLGLLEAALKPESRRTDDARRSVVSGRFGWKNQFASIDDAVAAALANELGLISPQLAHSGHSELSREQIRAISQFVRLLPPPSRGDGRQTARGRQLFDAVGCGSCHRPALRTGPSPFPALRNQVFEAYTDLALHDLGAGLSDGFDSGDVRGSEFRTPPLWGLSQSGPPYLHDGRADTLDRAIELHAGEASTAVESYRRLSAADRKALVDFLRSL